MRKAYKTSILKEILKVQRLWQRNVIYEKTKELNFEILNEKLFKKERFIRGLKFA